MITHTTHSKPNTRGFTLIELMVVISIIGLMSSVVLAAVNSAKYAANDAKRFSDLRQMEKALDTYYADNGKYPTTSSTWNSLCPYFNTVGNENLIVGSPSPAFIGTYISSIPQDPAANPSYSTTGVSCYAYYSNGTDYKFIDWTPLNSNTSNPRVSSLVDPAWTTSLGFRWAVWSAGGRSYN